jgi:hypothetical protein
MLQQTRPTRRHERRARRRRPLNARTAASPVQASTPQAVAVSAAAAAAASCCDPAVARAQEAGGPMDLACYSCGCGYYFAAPVSTTVSCPHCGAGQAW